VIRRLPQVTTFLAAVFAVPWAMYFLLRDTIAAGQQSALLTWVLVTVWTPTLVALLLSFRSGGALATMRLAMRLVPRRGTLHWLLLAITVPAAITLSAVLAARAFGDASPYLAPSGALPMIALQMMTGATGEELGWRGFLFAELEAKMGSLRAAMFMASAWSLWHICGLLVPGVPQHVVPPGLFLLSVALFGIFLALLFVLTRGSVLATMFAHLSLNVALGLGGTRPTSLAFWCTMVAGFCIVATISLYVLRARDSACEVRVASP
jgi:CAAX protease family protein